MSLRSWRLLCAVLLIGGVDSAALAQTSTQIPLQFDFINPGAKSLGMGGSFVALADDASATFTNPAGLILVSRSEFAFEGRHTRVETPFLERGRLSGVITREGTDTIQGPFFGTSVGTHGGVALAAGIYSRAPSSRWRVAGYRHELVRVDQRFLTNGVFQKLPNEFTSRRDTPQEGIRDVELTGYGATAAFRLHPEVAIGAGVTVYRFELDSQFRRLDADGFFGPPLLDAPEFGRSTQKGSDTSIAPTLGALVGLTGRVRGGVMYRHGPGFSFQTQDGTDPERTGRFLAPHTFGGGVSVRPLTDATSLVVAFEVTRINYSRLTRDFVTDQARASQRESSFSIQDGTEVHLGAQYLPTLEYFAPKFRIGLWRDPNHSVTFQPSGSSNPLDQLFDERLSAALSQGKTLVHVSGGLGLSLNPRLEVNVAFDRSSRGRVLSVSTVLR